MIIMGEVRRAIKLGQSVSTDSERRLRLRISQDYRGQDVSNNQKSSGQRIDATKIPNVTSRRSVASIQLRKGAASSELRRRPRTFLQAVAVIIIFLRILLKLQ